MKPHIEIRTDKPEELLQALDDYKHGRRLPKSFLLQGLKASHFRLVETEHQGFASYETFAIGVVIDSDREQLDSWLGTAKRCLKALGVVKAPNPEEAAELFLAELLKDQFDRNSPNIRSPWSELCNAGLSRIDWLDLARHYISKVREGVTV